MAIITSKFGTGGSNVVPGKEGGSPGLADVLRDIADDLLGSRLESIVSANASDDTSSQTLVNEIKAVINRAAFRKGTTRGTVRGPFNITAGHTLTYKVDGGSTITSTFAAAAAVATSPTVGPYDLTGGGNLRIKINGHDNGGHFYDIGFTDDDFVDASAATAAELATVINAAIPSSVAVASNSSGSLVITTHRRGTGAAVQIVGGNIRGPLGFDTGIVTGTGDSFDNTAVTVAEVAAKIATDSAGTAEVLDVNGRVLIRTLTDGSGGSIQVTGGTASAAFGLSDSTARTGTTAIPTLTEKG